MKKFLAILLSTVALSGTVNKQQIGRNWPPEFP